MIACGICANAGSEMPALSLWETTSIAVILPSSTVTASFTSPPMPLPTPSKVSAIAPMLIISIAATRSNPRIFFILRSPFVFPPPRIRGNPVIL